jgi:NADPH-dependent 2,4-dienoyl-CoA reductase/sulfur reductase-like enzyme
MPHVGPSILAAGDVAVWHCRWAGRRMRLESWQNAQEQGIAAGRSALGIEVDHQPLPWFWSDQYETNLQIYGMPDPAHRVVVRVTPSRTVSSCSISTATRSDRPWGRMPRVTCASRVG